MLNRVSDRYPNERLDPPRSVEIGLPDILLFFRRHFRMIAAFIVATAILGLAYLLVTEPKFTAAADLLLDTRKVEAFGRGNVFEESTFNNSAVESQVQILASEGLAGVVVDKLKLAENPTFMAGSWDPVSAARGFVMSLVPASSTAADPSTARRRKAIEVLKKNLSVTRRGLSYMITVGYTAATPALAAQIANEICNSYLGEQLNAQLSSAQRASGWFENRLRDLRQKAVDADNAAQQFRVANRLVNTGPNKGLMDEQRLSELTSQIGAVSGQVSQTRAQLEQIEQIKKSGAAEATLSDAVKNEIIVRLRQQYLELAQNEADLARRYGQTHETVVNLRSQMAQIRQGIASELDRIGEGYRSDYAIASARLDALQKGLDELLSQASDQAQAQAKLRDLESTANSVRAIYDGLLSRYSMAVQQETSPFTAAQVVSMALPPIQKSAPKTLLVLAGAVAFGGMLGIGTALARELTDRRVRTRQQVMAATSLNVIGILPQMSFLPSPARVSSPGKRTFVGEASQAVVLNEPFSMFSETVRGIKVAADLAGLRGSSKVIGVVSALPDEGKSTVAMNVARLAAQGGGRVLVVDGDLRHPSLSRKLGAGSAPGVVQAVDDPRRLEGLLWSDELTALKFLPAGSAERVINSHEVLSSAAMQGLLKHASDVFDLVIFDFPPLASVVDVSAAAHLIDAFVLVVEWGQTSEDSLREVVQSSAINSKVLGVVINKVDLARLDQFDRSAKQVVYSGYYVPGATVGG